jgi:hypothetical protein
MAKVSSVKISALNLSNEVKAGLSTAIDMVTAGTVDASDAVAGYIGELITATKAVGATVSLTSTTAANINSITLTPGDWDVEVVTDFAPAATTSVTQLVSSISVTSATVTGQAGGSGVGTDPTVITSQAASVPASTVVQVVPPVRISVSANTVVYQVAQGTFSISTMTAFGTIRARRVR